MNQPNFLVFMTDHQRADTLYPYNLAKTPNANRLSKNGVVFTHAFAPSPHCCPARATFFSGLYPSDHGVWNNVDVSNTLSRGLFDNVTLFSEDLKQNGYDLYFSGKWHVSSCESPADRGFEIIHHTNKYEKLPNVPSIQEWNRYDVEQRFDEEGDERGAAQIIRPGYPRYTQYGIHDNPFGDEVVVEKAVEKIKMLDGTKPFFMYVGPLGPHDPYIPPQKFLDLYDIDEIELSESFTDTMEDKPALYRRTRDRYSQLTREEHKESIRRYLAFCSYEDDLFGQILDSLEERGLTENTVILYVSDHGDYMGAHGLWAKGLPCFREAYNVCSVIGGAGIINPGRVSDALVSLADFAPTILEITGISVDRHFAGKSLVPFLLDKEMEGWRSELYTQSNGNEIYGIQRSVFDKQFKYVYNTFDYDEFYNLEIDPHEMSNGINNPIYHDKIKELCKKIWQFARENHDNCVNPYIMTALAPYGPGILYEDK